MEASNEFILWTFRLDEDRYNERASWKVPLKPALRVWSRLKKKKEWFELKRRKEDPRGEVQFEFPASRVHSSSTEGRVVNEMADRQQLAIRSQLIVCRGSKRRIALLRRRNISTIIKNDCCSIMNLSIRFFRSFWHDTSRNESRILIRKLIQLSSTTSDWNIGTKL